MLIANWKTRDRSIAALGLLLSAMVARSTPAGPDSGTYGQGLGDVSNARHGPSQDGSGDGRVDTSAEGGQASRAVLIVVPPRARLTAHGV